MSERLNETELARIVGSQKQRILDLLSERDEARLIARNLLRDLRNHAGEDEIPAVDPSWHWLLDETPITEERNSP